ncbi:MAG: hypothetical protein F6K55_14165 [Moorea sp. SIO4A3]|nr:hypothetical protein [Moorena sp. SIO4A3]
MATLKAIDLWSRFRLRPTLHERDWPMATLSPTADAARTRLTYGHPSRSLIQQ